MYNYSINLTYLDIDDNNQDTQYRKEYLNAFNIKQYDETIVMKTLNELYGKYKNNDQMKDLFKYRTNNIFSFNDEMFFTMCFAFETFYYFHKCLVDLNNNNTIDDYNYKKMIEILQKK
jgi:hypothetical protein